MLWDVLYMWLSGAKFTFNYYHHWDTMVVRDALGSDHFFHSKEGVTQGGPLDMVTYGIGIFPLI